jgi:hypothetical protein
MDNVLVRETYQFGRYISGGFSIRHYEVDENVTADAIKEHFTNKPDVTFFRGAYDGKRYAELTFWR